MFSLAVLNRYYDKHASEIVVASEKGNERRLLRTEFKETMFKVIDAWGIKAFCKGIRKLVINHVSSFRKIVENCGLQTNFPNIYISESLLWIVFCST